MITQRKVNRWYFKGKGYSTKRRAYEAWAKSLMLDMVFGRDDDNPCGTWHNEGRDNETMRMCVDERFAEFFPHDDSPACIDRCRRINQEYDGWGRCTCEGDHAFKSCKAAQKAWIAERVSDLMENSKEDCS